MNETQLHKPGASSSCKNCCKSAVVFWFGYCCEILFKPFTLRHSVIALVCNTTKLPSKRTCKMKCGRCVRASCFDHQLFIIRRTSSASLRLHALASTITKSRSIKGQSCRSIRCTVCQSQCLVQRENRDLKIILMTTAKVKLYTMYITMLMS